MKFKRSFTKLSKKCYTDARTGAHNLKRKMKNKALHLINIFSFVLGILFFIFLEFNKQNPIKLYSFSYVCLLNIFGLVIRRPISIIFLVIPILTIIFLIISFKTKNKIIKILTFIFLFLFNLNQYLILENLMNL